MSKVVTTRRAKSLGRRSGAISPNKYAYVEANYTSNISLSVSPKRIAQLRRLSDFALRGFTHLN